MAVAAAAPLRRGLPGALFWAAAAALTAVRLGLAVRAPRLHEIEHIWQPIAREALAGGLLWANPDYHFFPIWGWILPAFERAGRLGLDFAAAQRLFLVAVDVGIAAAVYRLAGRVPGAVSPAAAALSFLANPAGAWVSSVQGQFDGLALLFLLAALLVPTDQERWRAGWRGVLLGLSIASKQVTIFHPLLWLRRRGGVATAAVAFGLPALLLVPYAFHWRVIGPSLLVYRSVPHSYGFSEFVLYDSRFAPAVSMLAAVGALAAVAWLGNREPARASLFLFLVLLLLAPGFGSQYLLWPIPFGAVFGGARYVFFSACGIAWILGMHFGVLGSGRWMGQLLWLSVALWLLGELRVLGGGRLPWQE